MKCCKIIEAIHSEIVEQHLTVEESCKPFITPSDNIYNIILIFEFSVLDLFYVEIFGKIYLDKNLL